MGLYLDLEYTCWDGPAPMDSEVIQLGIVEVEYATLTLKREEEFLVRPYKSLVSPFCTKLTSITPEMVKTGRRLEDVIRTLLKNWGPTKKICYTWGSDDAPLLQFQSKELGVPWSFHIVDLALLFHQTFNLDKSMSLDKALEFLGLKFVGRMHSAMADASNLALLHIEIIRRLRGTVVTGTVVS